MGIFQWLYKFIFRKNGKRNRNGSVCTSNIARNTETVKKSTEPKTTSDLLDDRLACDAKNSERLIREVKAVDKLESADVPAAVETVVSPDEPEAHECIEECTVEAMLASEDVHEAGTTGTDTATIKSETSAVVEELLDEMINTETKELELAETNNKSVTENFVEEVTCEEENPTSDALSDVDASMVDASKETEVVAVEESEYNELEGKDVCDSETAEVVEKLQNDEITIAEEGVTDLEQTNCELDTEGFIEEAACEEENSVSETLNAVNAFNMGVTLNETENSDAEVGVKKETAETNCELIAENEKPAQTAEGTDETEFVVETMAVSEESSIVVSEEEKNASEESEVLENINEPDMSIDEGSLDQMEITDSSEQYACTTAADEISGDIELVETDKQLLTDNAADAEIEKTKIDDAKLEKTEATQEDVVLAEEITDIISTTIENEEDAGEEKRDESAVSDNQEEISDCEENQSFVQEYETDVIEKIEILENVQEEPEDENSITEDEVQENFETPDNSEASTVLPDDRAFENDGQTVDVDEDVPVVSKEGVDADENLIETNASSESNANDVSASSVSIEETEVQPRTEMLVSDETKEDAQICSEFEPTENICVEIETVEQPNDVPDESNICEEQVTVEACSFAKTSERLHELKERSCENWPLRRLLAFGASQEEIMALKMADEDSFSALEQFDGQNTAFDLQKYAWVERLESQEWESAFLMCKEWQELLQTYSLASNIEHWRASGFSENLILAKTKLTSAEAQRLHKHFRAAVLQWLNNWHAALAFLFDDGVLQNDKAEFFFGKLTFAIILSVAEEAPNYGCAWLVYHELPFVLWNPSMKISKYSVAVLAEETLKQLKNIESYSDLAAWFEKELQKKNMAFQADTLLKILLAEKNISPDDAIFKKGTSFHHVLKGEHTREADSTHLSMADEWAELGKWLLQQFRLQPMLGAIELHDDEYAVLMNDFPKRIHYLRSIDDPEITDPLVCVELVQFAIRESKSGALWTKLGNLLCCKNTDPVMQWIGNLFIRTLIKYHKAVYEAGEKVASVLMHCFVCDAHIGELFDFLYAYYRLDLVRDTEQMDVAALRERMVNNERYSYSNLILQQTLDAMKYMPEISIARFEKYISWIDQAFWDVDWENGEQGRFARIFDHWRKKHPDFNGSLHHHKVNGAKGKRYFSKPYLELDLKNGKFGMVLPVQKLRFGMEEGACWKVKTNVQQTFPCELLEAVTCYHTEEIRVPLDESALLSEMTFELFANGKTKHLWTIEMDCYRAFDEKGLLITDAHLDVGTVYLFTAPAAQVHTQASCTQQMHGSWRLSVYSFAEGDIVSFPDRTVTVVGNEMEEGLCGALPVENAYISLADGANLPVYAEKPRLLLQTSDEHFATGRLLLNGAYQELAKLEHQSYSLKNRTDECWWLVELPDAGNGLYQMQVDIAGEKDKRIWQFAVVAELNYAFEGELPYWNQTVGKMKVTCNVPFQAMDMEFVEEEDCYQFEISAKRQENRLMLNNGLQLSIRIPMICWRVPDGEWSVASPGDLWYTEFPDKIEFRLEEKHLTLSVDDEAGMDKQHSIYGNAVHGSEIISCDTMPLHSWFTRNRVCHSVYLTVGDVRRSFAQVYRVTYLQSAVFTPDFENNSIKGFLNLAGNGECVVRLFKGKEMVSDRTTVVEGKADIFYSPEPGVYKACVYEVESDEFGFDETLYLLGEFEFKVKDPGNITGMTGYLKEIEPTEEHPDPLVLPHKYYWIDIIQRDPNNPNRYAAQLREDDDFARMFGKYHPIPVYVILPNRTNIRRVRITYPMQPIPRAFMYEPKSHRLVKREKASPNAIKLDSLDIFHIKFVEKV